MRWHSIVRRGIHVFVVLGVVAIYHWWDWLVVRGEVAALDNWTNTEGLRVA